jgi:D-erythro-7,8-dihydroneopterin triphosphate epimerase
LDIAVEYESKAGRTDRLQDAVDYKRIKNAALEYVEGSQHQLLEALAQGVADTCLAQKGVKAASITVDKPGALRFARSVAVEIRREARLPRAARSQESE